jgi:uncharacterized protein involved in outer membrane biogenesis
VRFFRRLLFVFLVVAVGLGACLFALTYIDLRRFAGEVEIVATDVLDRPLRINGAIRIALSADGVSAVFEDVRIGNAPWGQAKWFFEAARVEAFLDPLELRARNLSFARVKISDADLFLESGPADQSNFPSVPARTVCRTIGPLCLGKIATAEFEHLKLYQQADGQSQHPLFALSALSLELNEQNWPVRAQSSIGGLTVEAVGTLEEAVAGLESGLLPLDITLYGDRAEVAVKGQLGLLKGSLSDLHLKGSAPDLTDLGVALGVMGLPENQPSSFEASVVASNANLLIEDFAAAIGHGQINGALSLEFHQTGHTVADGAFTADLFDLTPFIPNALSNDQSNATPESSALALPIEFLRTLSADVTFTSERVLVRKAEFVGADINFHAGAAEIIIEPVTLDYANAPITFSFGAAISDVAVASMRIGGERIDARNLLRELSLPQMVGANAAFAAELTTQGRTFGDLVANLNGQTNLLVDDGLLNVDLDAILGAQLVRRLSDEIGATPVSNMSCLISRFEIVDGLATSRGLLLETAAATATGSGHVDLKSGELNFKLSPRPKDPRFLKAATDLIVTGTIGEPRSRPSDAGASKGVAGALGGFALTSDLDAILPLLTEDAGADNVCLRALRGS